MRLVQKAFSSSPCTTFAATQEQGFFAEAPRIEAQRQRRVTHNIPLVESLFLDRDWLRMGRRLIIACCVPLFLCLCSVAARCQVFSRPAAVELIARVESIGLSITQNSLPGRSAVPSGSEGQDFVIKTSWAVPPNYTRLSLIRSISSRSAQLRSRCLSADGTSKEQNGVGIVALDSGGRGVSHRDEASDEAFSSSCQPMWTQPSGSTNQANEREDPIDLPGRRHDAHRGESKEPLGVIVLSLEAF